MNPLPLAVPLLLATAGSAELRDDLSGWRVEAQVPARVTVTGGVLEIDAREGVTVWRERRLRAPVRIVFEAMAVDGGGANDAVSDVNAFWMAHEANGGDPRPRGGTFEEYDTLATYYVGIGGNRNTSTRMRRYVARTGVRPLLPQHDRADTSALLRANRWTRIALIADGRRAAVVRDGCVLFVLDDAAPYTAGWFGLRTTRSHLSIRNVRIDAHVDISRMPHCPAPSPAPDRPRAPAATPAGPTP